MKNATNRSLALRRRRRGAGMKAVSIWFSIDTIKAVEDLRKTMMKITGTDIHTGQFYETAIREAATNLNAKLNRGRKA